MATTRDDLPKAITNTEHFLAVMAGTESVDQLPPAITNTDKYLDYLARNGGGGVSKAYVDEQIADVRDDIPANTSDLTNDSEFTDKSYVDTQGALRELKSQQLTYAEYQALETKDPNRSYYIPDYPADETDISELFAEIQIQQQIHNRIYQGVDLTIVFADEIDALPYSGDTWAWIRGRIQAGNFKGIHVGDYIPFTTTNNVTLNAQIAGINTYNNYGNSAVGNHIDFICKELWPTLRPVNKVNYNNGTSAQSHPWLASDLYLYLNSLSGDVPNGTSLNPETVAVDYTADGVYYFLPTQLKNVIIEKKFLLPTRYSASGLLSDDNSWAWKNIGKLWLPDECEVYGMPVWGGKGGYSLGGSALQYPLFAGNMNRLKFRNGGRDAWWLLSPYSGNSTYWCYVDARGYCTYYASNSGVAAPVCFRVGTAS